MIKDKWQCKDIVNFKTPYHKPTKFAIQFYIFVCLFLSCYVGSIAAFAINVNIYNNHNIENNDNKYKY